MENLLEKKSIKDLKREFENVDIISLGNIYETFADNIKKECREYYWVTESMVKDMATILVNDLADLNDPTQCNCCDFDKEYVKEKIREIIKDSNKYIVCAYSYNWLGNTGYKFVDSSFDIFFDRDYDTMVNITGVSKGHKTITFRESHHDNPLGAKMVAVALTDSEYNMLENMEIADIMEFVEKNRRKVVEF